VAVLAFLGVTVGEENPPDAVVGIVVMSISSVVTFFATGYLVTAIAWIVEGFRK